MGKSMKYSAGVIRLSVVSVATVMLGLALVAQPVTAQAATCTLLILGDSLSSGYGLAPGKTWVDLLATRAAPRGWKVVNASVSGDTTQNGLARISPALARHKPGLLVIELGGNDALRGTSPALIRKHLTALVQQGKAAGAKVALLEAPVLPNYGQGYTQAVSKVFSELARREGLAHVPCFVCGVGTNAKLMQPDGIHPNEAAQPGVLAAVWPSFDPLLGACPK